MQQFRKGYNTIYIPMLLVLVIAFLLSAKLGAVDIRSAEIYSSLHKLFTSPDSMTLNERIFADIRLPRAILCILVGASLAVGGALMQALFRNPIVEPGLVGTSSGAALGAAFYFALGTMLHIRTSEWSLPIAACLGGMLATFLVFILSESRQTGRSSVVSLLLTGIAINALCLSGIGFLSYVARDPQARSIIFWNLGTISGATWHSVLVVGIVDLVCVILGLRYAKQLNALMIGEDEARYLGVNIRRLKVIILTINVIMVAVATAFTGVIAFVGLIVPHLLRIMKGSDNRYLIIGNVLMGAIILSLADLVARLIIIPAELPIGVVTSIVGVPVFIFLLRQKNYYF